MSAADPHNLNLAEPENGESVVPASLAELKSPAELRKTVDRLLWNRDEIARGRRPIVSCR